MGLWAWLTDQDKPPAEPTGKGYWKTVDPRRVRPMHGVDRDDRDRRDVAHYERNPDASLDGGYPWVREGFFGGMGVLQNGHHRRQAAINRGRKLRVWVDQS